MKKKNILKVCGVMIAMPLLLAGCATVSDVIDPATKKSVYYEDITYFGGSAMQIGDYLYYGNTFSEVTDAQNFDYSAASKEGYLGRLNLSGVKTDGKAPSGALEKVNDKLAGYNNQYMFAYQNYLYFTSANEHKDSSNKNYYDRVSVFRVKFNGDDMKELFTTRYDSSSFITAVEGSDGNAYIVTYSETEDKSAASTNTVYDISVMKIGDKLGSRNVVAKNVTSAVVDTDKNATNKDLFYTKTSNTNTTDVYSLNLATGKSNKFEPNSAASTTKLIAKTNDELFYYYTHSSTSSVYKLNLKNAAENEKIIIDESATFVHVHEISNVYHVAKDSNIFEGYVFVCESGGLMYYNIAEEKTTSILEPSKFTDILFVDGDYIYYSTSTEIGRISFKPNAKDEYEPQTLVSMTKIISGKYAFANGYIYFYAQYEPVKEYDADGKEIKYETDESVYMYRVKVADPDDNMTKPQLVSKNKTMKKIESED